MTNFERFKEQFNKGYSYIGNFISDVEEGKKPFNAELKLDEVIDISDSYDFTDEKIKKVYYFSEFDIFVQFDGRNQSYSGMDWDDMKEVKQTVKTVNEFEEVK